MREPKNYGFSVDKVITQSTSDLVLALSPYFLLLDASNDPITGNLALDNSNIIITTTGGNDYVSVQDQSEGASFLLGNQLYFLNEDYLGKIVYGKPGLFTITPDADFYDSQKVSFSSSSNTGTSYGNFQIEECNLTLANQGTRIYLNAGSGSGACGTSTLSGGTVTINNTSTTGNSIIMVQHTSFSGVPGILRVSQVANTSFTVTSSSATDAGNIMWVAFEPF